MAAAVPVAFWLMAQSVSDPLTEGFRTVEVASVADAMEQLYGEKGYMSHEMRPLTPTKFAGPAVTVLMKKEEHKEGSKASEGMLDAIDNAKPGSVYVMVLEDGVVVGRGTHDELIETNPTYEEIVQSQIGEREEAA